MQKVTLQDFSDHMLFVWLFRLLCFVLKPLLNKKY